CRRGGLAPTCRIPPTLCLWRKLGASRRNGSARRSCACTAKADIGSHGRRRNTDAERSRDFSGKINSANCKARGRSSTSSKKTWKSSITAVATVATTLTVTSEETNSLLSPSWPFVLPRAVVQLSFCACSPSSTEALSSDLGQSLTPKTRMQRGLSREKKRERKRERRRETPGMGGGCSEEQKDGEESKRIEKQKRKGAKEKKGSTAEKQCPRVKETKRKGEAEKSEKERVVRFSPFHGRESAEVDRKERSTF
ncbi:hypothetical protein TGFOU_404240, partial [Toxoplasma gondii FOU]